MTKGFRLYVRDFGKIQAADLSLTPMTFFVGDNNSGKSYLMALLYSLLNLRLYRQPFDLCTQSEEFQWCQRWLENAFSADPEPRKLELTFDTQEHFQALLNLILDQNRQKLTQITFNTPVSIGHISVELPKREQCFLLFSKQPAEDGDESRMRYSITPILKKRQYTRFWSERPQPTFFICAILEFLLKADFKLSLTMPACFLPTSRTGFLLTYKSLIQSTISDAFDISEPKTPKTELTRPCTDFLKNLASISTEHQNKQFQPVIDFIERNMIGGHISVSNQAPQPVFRYHPSHTDCELPMQLTSGVVTELTPLLLMLKYHSDMNVLFIEEPEMGLHPELQLQMARVLFRLYTAGLPIFITTHSDTILQHINNMLKLGTLEKAQQQEIMDELDYFPEDLAAPEDIELYQFDVDRATQKSTVTRLEKSRYGFIVPSFNNALRNLLEISRRMELDDDV